MNDVLQHWLEHKKKPVFTIEERDGNIRVLSFLPHTKLNDARYADELKTELAKLAKIKDVRLVVDMGNVEYCSSDIIRKLRTANNQISMTVFNIPEGIEEVFRIVEDRKLLNVVYDASVDEAINRCIMLEGQAR